MAETTAMAVATAMGEELKDEEASCGYLHCNQLHTSVGWYVGGMNEIQGPDLAKIPAAGHLEGGGLFGIYGSIGPFLT